MHDRNNNIPSPEVLAAQRHAEITALLAGIFMQAVMQSSGNIVARNPQNGEELSRLYLEAALGFVTAFEKAKREDDFKRLGFADPEPERLPFGWLAKLIYGVGEAGRGEGGPDFWPGTIH